MRLSKIKIHNYRCYRDTVEIGIDDLTCIIGKNDIGKSSVMEALDVFFNDTFDRSDLSTTAPQDDQRTEITCVFTSLPATMVLDTMADCSLEEEGLLNANGELEIKRVFDCSGRSVTKSTYVVCNYYIDEEAQGLLSKKKTTLKNFIDDNNIPMLEGGRKTISRDMRRAIRAHYNMTHRYMMEIKVDGSLDNEDNIKSIWKSISGQLPIFALFKMDRSLTDKDGNVQDPMKLAVEEALRVEEIQRKLQEIEEYVRDHTTSVADETIKKLQNFDKRLAERLKSSFSKVPKWSGVFDVTLLNDQNIPLNKRGSGIRRLVLLSFFQAEAEKRKTEKNAPSIIYAIEEPETSQHPTHQLEIIHNLIELSEQDNTQVIFTTHSANLVREVPYASIRYLERAADAAVQILLPTSADGTRNEAVLDAIIAALGILPNPVDKVKCLLYVEGNNDVTALKSYCNTLFNAGEIGENIMNSDKIGIVITGGSSLFYYLNEHYLEGLGKPEVHIYDNDKDDYRDVVARINAMGDATKVAYNTSKREMENFLCKEAIEESYHANGQNITLMDIEDDTDIPILVCTTFNPDWDTFDEEKKGKKEAKVKKMLNRQAVSKMTIDRLESRGVKDEIKGWFESLIEFSNR